MSALSRPVLHPPCEQCGEPDAHAVECEGEPHPETLHQALARAQSQADGQLRERIELFLGAPFASGMCVMCKRRGKSRYPDFRCAEHTVYLDGATGLDRRQQDNDSAHWLAVWREFFERLRALLQS